MDYSWQINICLELDTQNEIDAIICRYHGLVSLQVFQIIYNIFWTL